MTEKALQKVVIVGGGIAGPVLGICLRRLGLRVVIAERRASAALGGGAFLGVAPNGMNVLAELGLAPAVAAAGAGCDAFHFSNHRGKSLGTIDRSRDSAEFGWPLTMIRRSDLHELLASEAERSGVEIRFGKKLQAIERPQEDRVLARFEDGSSLEGDLLIGCDGLRSNVRALAIPDAPQPTFSGLLDFGGFVSGVRVPIAPAVNEMIFGRRAFFGAFVMPSGETWWFHNGPDAGAEDADARERLLELHAGDPAWIRDLIGATPRILGPWPIFDLVAMPRWSHDRICLIGDAAHAMSPSAGQGASLAMEDALVLAQCLRDVRDPVRAFAIFERLRRPRVDAIFRQARRNGSGKLAGGAASVWLRDRLLPLFLKLGASAQSRAYAHCVHWADSVRR